MNSLYALKPWYGRRLSGVMVACARYGISPTQLSVAGVAFGAAGGLALAGLPTGLPAAVVVAALLAIRLACANLDGGLSRFTDRSSRWGSIENELGDRLSDMAACAGLFFLATPAVALAVLLAASFPSWISLAGAAAGAQRSNVGPVGKTERCLLLVLTAAIGIHAWIAAVLVLGSCITAAVRLVGIRTELAGAR